MSWIEKKGEAWDSEALIVPPIARYSSLLEPFPLCKKKVLTSIEN